MADCVDIFTEDMRWGNKAYPRWLSKYNYIYYQEMYSLFNIIFSILVLALRCELFLLINECGMGIVKNGEAVVYSAIQIRVFVHNFNDALGYIILFDSFRIFSRFYETIQKTWIFSYFLICKILLVSQKKMKCEMKKKDINLMLVERFPAFTT